MLITKEQLDVFIEIYQKKYNTVLSHEQAYEVAFLMINLLKSAYD